MIDASPSAPRPRSVLIVKPSALGDVVTAVPVLRGLRRTFPRARLAWMLSNPNAPLMAHDTDLDEVVLFDRTYLGRAWRSPEATGALAAMLRRLRQGRFDWVIDLQGLLRSGFFAAATGAGVRAGFADAREGAAWFYTHRIAAPAGHTVDRNLAVAAALGVDARPEDMTLQVAPAAGDFAERLCRDRGLARGGFLVCVPPTRWRTKRYPVRHWRAVLRALSPDVPVAVLGTGADRALCGAVAEGAPGAIDLSGRTTVPQMVALIAASAGVVCCDSAAKFIAPAVGVDVVTLVGPTRLDRTGPYRRGAAVVADVPCQGCLRRRCRHITCMDLIAPGEVISGVREMLAQRSG